MNEIPFFYEANRDNDDYFCVSETYCDAHFHRSIEMLYCIKGEIEIVINGNEYTLLNGDLLFLPPMTVHKYIRRRGNIGVCSVMPIVYGEIYENAANGRIPGSFIFRKSKFTDDIYYHIKMLENASPALKNGIYCYITARVSEEMEFTDNTVPEIKDNFSFKLLSFLELHYNEELTLGSAAKALGYSRCYFSTLIQKNFKTGFSQLIGSARVRKTAAMLCDKPACEVAAAAGFNSVQSYYANFKRTTGITPGEYKKKIFTKNS